MKKALILLVTILPLLLIFTSCDDRPGSGTEDGGTESGIFYTLTIKNGEETTTEEVKEGTEYTLTAPEGTSYFEGWAVNGDEDNLKKAGEKIALTADTTITAIWDETKCTITLDYNYGGSEPKLYAVIEKGGQIETPRGPTRLGYSFEYWSTDKEGNKKKGDYPSQFLEDFQENTTLYAQWKEGYEKDYTITLGSYPGDTEGSGMEWRVLSYDKDNKRVLVISAVLLDEMAHTSSSDVTYKWSESNINKWLNSEEDDGFIKKYGLEDVPMATVKHKTEEGADNSTQPEETTNEKIFLLSKTEAETYFSSNDERTAPGTDARERNWLLRTPGAEASRVYFVNYVGTIQGGAISGNTATGALIDGKMEAGSFKFKVRPAFWIDLQSVL